MIKRVTRSLGDRKLFGVFGGIGNYYNIDPTILRLVYTALTIFNPTLVLIYILAICIIPEEI
ncbi:PspC domain-containing protein [Paraliobacillus sediminis]|uniref:PspC domain-containing protein n=1 Tax=Paraliobacillus sediminis TaxID=1885916 RepID=UPI000E3BE452|nr:PspC domain-containing protein [Paraliobacillus sediminis]